MVREPRQWHMPAIRPSLATMSRDPTIGLGYWSAVAATVLSIAYDLAQLAEWFGWLGSRGGPESTSTAFGLALLLTPSLLLGVAYLTLMAAVHVRTAPPRRVWSQAALAFATVYVTLIGLVYFVQLTLVAPRIAAGRTAGIELLLFIPFDSFLYAVDMLAYSCLSLSMLFAAPAFADAGPIERSARTWLRVNGLLLPFLALQMYVRGLIWIASVWAVAFPMATWSLARVFRAGPGRVRAAHSEFI